jgi:hypothetical protein
MEDDYCAEAVGGVNQGYMFWNGTVQNVWNSSSGEPFYSDELADIRIDFRVNIASNIWTKINMATYENGFLRVFLASFGVLLRPLPDYEGTKSVPEFDNSRQIQGIYYLILFTTLIGFCFASSYSLKNNAFSFEIFLAAMSIGLSLLIWVGVMPAYLLIIPALIIAGTLFIKVRSE